MKNLEKLFEQYSEFLSVKEIKEVLNIGNCGLYAKIRNGKIPCIRIGKTIRVHKNDLIAYLNRPVAKKEVITPAEETDSNTLYNNPEVGKIRTFVQKYKFCNCGYAIKDNKLFMVDKDTRQEELIISFKDVIKTKIFYDHEKIPYKLGIRISDKTIYLECGAWYVTDDSAGEC